MTVKEISQILETLPVTVQKNQQKLEFRPENALDF